MYLQVLLCSVTLNQICSKLSKPKFCAAVILVMYTSVYAGFPMLSWDPSWTCSMRRRRGRQTGSGLNTSFSGEQLLNYSQNEFFFICPYYLLAFLSNSFIPSFYFSNYSLNPSFRECTVKCAAYIIKISV